MNQPIPRIGEYWPEQAGIRVAVIPGQNGQPDYDLILPTHPDAELGELEYGSYGTKIEGADSEWDGLTNTQALVAAGNHPAAERCASLTIEGHNDFYLPADREAAVCYAIAREHFKKRWHWTSTQYGARRAFVQDFGGGGQDYDGKGCSFGVRPVRRVSHSSI